MYRKFIGTSLISICGLVLNVQADVTISGHVAYDIVDRSSKEDLSFQRHGFSESRFRLIADKDLDNGLKVGIVQEIGFAEGGGELSARRQEILIAGIFGGVLLGEGSDAGDGVLNGDTSGTVLIQPSSSISVAYGYSPSNYNGFDPDRGERVRYDSPKLLGGLIISGQIGENAENQVAFVYKNNFDDASSIRIGVFYSSTRESNTDSNGMLFSYLSNSGFNVSIATSSKDNAAGAGLDGEFDSIKLGYRFSKHAVSLITGISKNPKNIVETDSSGIGYVYKFGKGIELYAGIQEFDSSDNANDEDFILLGTRVKF